MDCIVCGIAELDTTFTLLHFKQVKKAAWETNDTESTHKSDPENNGKNAKNHFWEQADRNTQQSLLSMLI